MTLVLGGSSAQKVLWCEEYCGIVFRVERYPLV
jgi:hypothetical protein